MKDCREVLTFAVEVTQSLEVKGLLGEAQMILFTGIADCPNFKGRILPGGVDTQTQENGKNRLLSARYMLEGTDAENQSCRIFVINEAVIDDTQPELITRPRIVTDSKQLQYLEQEELRGTITPADQGITIHIFCKEKKEMERGSI